MIEPPDHLELTDEQARVLGVLIEKQATTPDVYPMTLRAVTTGCNQSTSRHPVVDYPDAVVERTLDELKAVGLVRMVHPGAGERSTKYRHVADEALGLDQASCAVLCVLLLRGPQTAAELKARTDRIHRFDTTGSTEAALHTLADHPRRLAIQLERLPGHKERRWAQLLAGPPGSEPDPTGDATGRAPTAPAAATVADDPPPASPTDDGLATRLDAIEARLDWLERRVAGRVATRSDQGLGDTTEGGDR
jgi:uncharacterized protein YceH (UPF0502 family)